MESEFSTLKRRPIMFLLFLLLVFATPIIGLVTNSNFAVMAITMFVVILLAALWAWKMSAMDFKDKDFKW